MALVHDSSSTKILCQQIKQADATFCHFQTFVYSILLGISAVLACKRLDFLDSKISLDKNALKVKVRGLQAGLKKSVTIKKMFCF